MATDDILTRPLGAKPSAGQRLRSLRQVRITAPLMLGGLVAGLVVGLSILVVVGDPEGGEPSAVAAITLREPVMAPVAAQVPPKAERPKSASSSADEVETASGVTVFRPTGTAAPTDAVVIQVPSAAPIRLSAAPDSRLIERGRHGNLPRLGEGRLRSLDVYARPEAGGGSGPRVAILVSGLGIGQAATASAITRLPPAVSLAFAPYGGDLERTVTRAREAGHEVLLQAPMEPFDYPDSDPGPQTLLTTSRPPENLDRLSWIMSRFPGFVGIVNYMGAKLTSDAAALDPVLREIGARGLGFVDDGTSPRSLATTLAGKAKVPVARAEIVLDALARPEAIDRELARLEAQARQKGFALASASAMPMSIDRIARWAAEAESRGIRLVPVSVALRGSGPTRLTSAKP
ncbi:divergent polysaccharide deacetylase family protein [Methylobacterium sp. J-068]|nr:divergent polysaccharide deacetylase family protein [Methylobacterium sp. J-068]MCJ2036690.1 divergent polysaccharide deacetylase family protein [Methylobacterium sp. J-068]